MFLNQAKKNFFSSPQERKTPKRFFLNSFISRFQLGGNKNQQIRKKLMP